jgi:hypothetical protein
MVAKNFGVSWIAGRGTVDYKGRNTGGLCPSHMFKFGCSLEVGLWAKEFVNLIFLNYEMQTKIKSCPVPGFKKKMFPKYKLNKGQLGFFLFIIQTIVFRWKPNDKYN